MNKDILINQTPEEQSALTADPASALPETPAPDVSTAFDISSAGDRPILSDPRSAAGLALSGAASIMPDPAPMKLRPDMLHRFKPGRSGNPFGRPKRTREQKESLKVIRSFAPLAVEVLESLLKSDDVSAADMVRICELILDRACGKAGSAVRVTSARETVEESRSCILSLVENICSSDPEASP